MGKIGNCEYIIFGTGKIFTYLKEKYEIDVNKHIICFIDNNKKRDKFEGKQVFTFDEFVKENISGNIIICSSYFKEILYSLLDKGFPRANIFNAYALYLMDNYESIFSLFKFKNKITNYLISNKLKNTEVVESEKKLIFYVKNWGFSLIPFHTIVFGILLRRNGLNIEFLLDDCSRYNDSILEVELTDEANIILENLLELTKQEYNINFKKISEYRLGNLNDLEKEAVKRSIYLNKIWESKKVIFKDEYFPNDYEKMHWEIADRFKTYLSEEKIEQIYLFSGVHHEYHVIDKLCQFAEVQRFSFESFRNGSTFSISGPVVLQNDLASLEEYLENDQIKEYLVSESKEHFETIKKSLKKFEIDDYVLIPLNIFWDSASFSNNDLFESFIDWLDETITYIIEVCNKTVIVRQHPHETIFGTGGELKYYLKRKFGSSHYFIYIEAEQEISTYDLIYNARLVLPNTSTVGIEAAAIGKNVILKNDVYYCYTEFVTKAQTKKEYFNAIEKILFSVNEPISERKIEKAKMYYSLTSLLEMKKVFGQDNEDVLRWMDFTLDQLMDFNEINLILKAIKKNTSLIQLKIEGKLNTNLKQ